MFYRDEDRSMKELQESALFTVLTADEGTLGKKKKDIFVLLNIWNLNNLNFKLKLEMCHCAKEFLPHMVYRSQLCEIGSNQA